MYHAIKEILRQRDVEGDAPDDFWVQDDGAGPYIARWDAAKLGAIPTADEIAATVVPAPVWEVRPLLVVERMKAAGIFDAAMEIIDAQDRYTQERWVKCISVKSDDAQVRAIIVAAGGDPDAILAPEGS